MQEGGSFVRAQAFIDESAALGGCASACQGQSATYQNYGGNGLKPCMQKVAEVCVPQRMSVNGLLWAVLRSQSARCKYFLQA